MKTLKELTVEYNAKVPKTDRRTFKTKKDAMAALKALVPKKQTGQLDRDAKVHVLADETPFRKGSKEAAKWKALLKNGTTRLTVGHMLDVGINGVGIRRCAERGWIEIAS